MALRMELAILRCLPSQLAHSRRPPPRLGSGVGEGPGLVCPSALRTVTKYSQTPTCPSAQGPRWGVPSPGLPVTGPIHSASQPRPSPCSPHPAAVSVPRWPPMPAHVAPHRAPVPHSWEAHHTPSSPCTAWWPPPCPRGPQGFDTPGASGPCGVLCSPLCPQRCVPASCPPCPRVRTQETGPRAHLNAWHPDPPPGERGTKELL